jgi:hypothetical protein
VERLAVYPLGGPNEPADGVEVLRPAAGVRVCYTIPNASQALIKVAVKTDRGATVGLAEGAAPPNGQKCEDFSRIEGGLVAGLYNAQILDATDQLIQEKRFTVR